MWQELPVGRARSARRFQTAAAQRVRTAVSSKRRVATAWCVVALRQFRRNQHSTHCLDVKLATRLTTQILACLRLSDL